MKTDAQTPSSWSRWLSLAQDAALVTISALFFYSFATNALETGTFTNVFFAVEQALLVGMFLVRRRSVNTSTRIRDWIAATFGTGLPLLIRPHDSGAAASWVGSGFQLVGLLCVMISFTTLGKSFGIVAANRGLKVGGPYQFVRHPIYFSHALTTVGVVIANFWWPNLVIFGMQCAFQVLRIAAEERVLVATSDYASYKERVRWRLVPGLY